MTAPFAAAEKIATASTNATAIAITKTITIKYFASIREALGISSETCTTRVINLGELRTELQTRNPAYAAALATSAAIRVALNQYMADDTAVLHHGDEVAFFPPVTGG